MLLCASHWHANQTQCARVNSFTHIQQFSGRSYLVQEVVRQMSLAVLIAVSPACGELPMCDVTYSSLLRSALLQSTEDCRVVVFMPFVMIFTAWFTQT